MSLFKPKQSYMDEMREQLLEIMAKYAKEDPDSAEATIPIFSQAEKLLSSSSEKDIKDILTENKCTIDFLTLNILQNCAMTEIKPRTARDIIARQDENKDAAFDLYSFINQLKLDKGYIDKQQFDDNAVLATQIALGLNMGFY